MAAIKTIRVDITDLWPTLQRHVAKMPQTSRAALEAMLLQTMNVVTRDYMSFSRDFPPVPQGLRRITGTAVKSVRWEVGPVNTDRIIGKIGSPLIYVAAHERGVNKTVQVRAHVRQLATNKRTLMRRKKKGLKTEVKVRAHPRKMNLIARRMFDQALKRTGPTLRIRIREAFEKLAATGNPPRAGDLL